MINIALTFLVILIAGCQTQTYSYPQFYSPQDYSISLPPPVKNALVKPLDLKELPETIRTEHEDRVNRLARLSRQFNAQAPLVQKDLQVAPGTVSGVNFPTPVIRIRYEERTFFDFNKADIRPQSSKILDVIAEQMNRDLPDTSLVILGHTDSIGTDEYNNQLSLRRAAVVMSELAKRGVNREQMSTVAIGESQPIATNETDQGRTLNRRVEFMLSRFAEANYVAIEQFPRNSEWLNNHPIATSVQPSQSPEAVEKLPIARVDAKPKKLVVLKPSKAKTVDPVTKENIVALSPQESPRIVTLLPAEKITVELLPN